MRPGPSFGVVLNCDERKVLVNHPLNGVVVKVDLSHLKLFRECFGVNGKVVVLAGDENPPSLEVLYRLIAAWWPNFSLNVLAPRARAVS